MDESKKQFWLNHIEGAKRFDGTQSQYCAQHGIKPASLSAYKAMLVGRRVSKRSRFTKVEISDSPRKDSSLPDPIWLASFLRAWSGRA